MRRDRAAERERKHASRAKEYDLGSTANGRESLAGSNNFGRGTAKEEKTELIGKRWGAAVAL